MRMKIPHNASMIRLFLLALTCLGYAFPLGAESRIWVGPDRYQTPLHNWGVEDDQVVAYTNKYEPKQSSSFGSRLFVTDKMLGLDGDFTIRFSLQPLDVKYSNKTQAGLRLGVTSPIPYERSVWNEEVRKGNFFVGIQRGKDVSLNGKQLDYDVSKLKQEPIEFEITGKLAGNQAEVIIKASVGERAIGMSEEMLSKSELAGFVSLIVKGDSEKWSFGDGLKIEGSAWDERPEYKLGPVLWTQYTTDLDTVRVQAQFVPTEGMGNQTATIEIKQNGTWQAKGEAPIRHDSATALFVLEQLDLQQDHAFRVRYQWNGQDFYREGTIRENPVNNNEFSIALLNCDRGGLFPQDDISRNVVTHNPDMVFFAGDQFYEFSNFCPALKEGYSFEATRLSYLGKWYLFGISYRSILKDRPSVIIPDDHDVFMGNVWGDSGRGYDMPPRWVNMVQETQTGSLPPYQDREPLFNGIKTYFTDIDYAGMSFAVIEDRKFKSNPSLAKKVANRKNIPVQEVDIPELSLLGDRQLAFLRDWNESTSDKPFRWVLSQTLFGMGSTHNGAQLSPNRLDFDTNGWPRAERDKALKTLSRDVIMLCGDQHLGMLTRLGIEEWGDGPLAFMVTGSSVGYPRAWWPDEKPVGGEVNGPYTGNYFDAWGNRLSVYGVTNPDPLPDSVADMRGSAFKRLDHDSRIDKQHAKGSGYGIISVDKSTDVATFHAYRLKVDAANPKPSDQFPGFPYSLKVR